MSARDLYSLAGERYDISSPAIRCRAESDGAKVFEIEGRIGKLRVLDFSEKEAEITYREEADQVEPLTIWKWSEEYVFTRGDTPSAPKSPEAQSGPQSPLVPGSTEQESAEGTRSTEPRPGQQCRSGGK